jgi:hypothetical protein
MREFTDNQVLSAVHDLLKATRKELRHRKPGGQCVYLKSWRLVFHNDCNSTVYVEIVMDVYDWRNVRGRAVRSATL